MTESEGLTIHTPALCKFLDLIREGKRGKAAESLIAQYGEEAIAPLNVENLIRFLYQLGWLAPIGEFRPPVGAHVKRHNAWISVAPSTDEFYSVCGAAGAKCKKFREVEVTPLDRTAEDNVRFSMMIKGTDFFLNVLSSASLNPRANTAQNGDFSSFENFNLPAGAKVDFIFTNVNADSTGRVRFFALEWDA